MINNINIEIYDEIRPALIKDWDEFAAKADCYIFQTPGWIRCWIESVGKPLYDIQVCIIIVRRESIPILLLPMTIRKNRFGIRILEWLGGRMADYQGPLLERNLNLSGPELEEIWSLIIKKIPSFDVIHFKKQPELIGSTENPFIRFKYNVHYLNGHSSNLESDWNDFYEKHCKKKIRLDSQRQRRRLAEIGEIRMRIAENSKEHQEFTEAMISQKRKRYKATGVWDMLSVEEHRIFYMKMKEYLTSGEILHVSVLEAGNYVIAASWNAIYKNRFYYLMPAFEDGQWIRYSTSRLHLEYLIQWAFDHHVKTFDFTIGDEDYKKNWCDHTLKLYECISAVSMLGHLYFWTYKVRALIRNI